MSTWAETPATQTLSTEPAAHNAREAPVRVVGIGASAGGLEALRELVRGLRSGAGACFVVAQHLSPSHRSMLVELLARETNLRIRELEDAMEPVADIVYVTPPTCHVRLVGGRFKLAPASEAGTPKPSVDQLFSSLADSIQGRAVGVVLSGTGSDGARGVRAIHAAGGHTLAQDPHEARYDGMPRAAIETGCIDVVGTVDVLVEQLLQLLTSMHGPHAPREQPDEGSRVPSDILSIVKRRTGFDLSLYKPNSVERRLRRRIAATEAGSMEAYALFLQRSAAEADRLVREMFISVTQFFRDRDAFAALDEALSSRLSAIASDDELRIWVPGCATGEEAYSLTMLIAEQFERLQRWPAVRLFATDMDIDALAKARRGVFALDAIKDIPTHLAEKYLVATGDNCQIAKRLRDMVIFSEHNILRDPAFLRLDMISCRNLLIYLKPLVQEQVISTFAQALKPDGLLFLGKAEVLLAQPDRFAAVDAHHHLYRSRGDTAWRRTLRLGPNGAQLRGEASDSNKTRQAGTELGWWLLRAHTDGILPPFVLVDDDVRVAHVFGDVSPWLGLNAGMATLDLMKLVRDDIRLELRSTFLSAQRQPGQRIRATLWMDAGRSRTQLSAVRRSGPGLQALTLVMFEPLAADLPSESDIDRTETHRELRNALEDQLTATRNHLSTVIGELEYVNEELQSLNEEMQSANEELQSANEELETANEELQSANEELITVNEELESRTAELALLNADLQNVKDSQVDPLIVLDEHRRVMLFNPAAQQVFTLNADSQGILLFSAPCHLELGDLAALIGRVIAEGIVLECQLYGKRNYLLRAQPYRGATGAVKGAVLSFQDNTDLLAGALALQQSKEETTRAERFARATIDALDDQIAVLDCNGRLISTNTRWNEANARKCLTTWGCDAGSNLLDALLQGERNGHRLATKMLELLRKVLSGEQRQFSIEYECDLESGGRHFRTSIQPFAEGNYADCWIMTNVDITQTVRQEALVKLQARALNSSTSAISISDAQLPDLPLVYVNAAFESMTGYTANEVLGLNCRMLQGLETDQPALQPVRKALAQNGTCRVLLRNYRKDGTLFWNELTLSPIFNGDTLTHYVGLQRDMTAVLASEAALKAAQERESIALTLAGLGSMELEIRSGRITLSTQHARLLGLPGDRFGIDLSELRLAILPADLPFFEDGVKLCVAGHQSLDIEYRIQWPDGTQHWLHTQGNAVVDDHGVAVRLVALSQDVSARKDAEERVRFIAHHDALTGLPNRSLLRDRMQLALNGARRKRSRLALLFIDLDHFKDVNDSLGHEVGDGLLMSVAERMRRCLRDTDTVCRQSGDEFIVLLPDVRDGNDASYLAGKLVSALGQPHQVLGHEVRVTCSAGVSIFPEDGDSIELLMRHADSAMYHAKGLGRNSVALFSYDMNARHKERLQLSTALGFAVSRRELQLWYQPQFSVKSGELVGIEALLRWQHPERGLLNPDSFIDAAEMSDHIDAIGEWVVREACHQAKKWQDAGLPTVPMAVNVSPMQLRKRSFIEKVSSALHDSGLASQWLELEITERALIHKADTAGDLMADLRAMGIRLALDDFGTGYSSLTYLHRFPVDKLKIDRSFIAASQAEGSASAIVRAIVSMGTGMGLKVVAEGVETIEQLAFLENIGCETFQGYLSGPVSLPGAIPGHVDSYRKQATRDLLSA